MNTVSIFFSHLDHLPLELYTKNVYIGGGNLKKTCTKCKEVKPLDDYYFNDRTKDGMSSQCKECLIVYAKERQKAIIKKVEYKIGTHALICSVCNEIFVSKTLNVKYCSDECRKKSHKLICKCCNKDFLSINTNVKYCSDECRKIVLKAHCVTCGKQYVRKSLTQKFCSSDCRIYSCTCVICDKEFKTKQTTKYCSDECKNKKIKMTCHYCKKEFIIEQIKKTSVKYCSDECGKKVLSTRSYTSTRKYKHTIKSREQLTRDQIEDTIRGKVNNLLELLKQTGHSLGGQAINYYNLPFNENIKTKVLERDEYLCQICSKDTGLHVHHKVKRKNGGNHELDNLITLCVSCHRAIETGNYTHAIKKCTRNAFINRNIPVNRLEAKLNQVEEKAKLAFDLKEVFRMMTEDETEDALSLLDDVIDRL